MTAAASETWRDNGEVLASGITTIPRLGASLAKMTHSPELLMTDSEAYRVIREQAMAKRVATEEIARAIIHADGILSLKTSEPR